ncbi:8967_t:CDS:2 [Funneliformis geosporum]|uniref:8967_t:CDS:1 n=1 Tax=Funneliformis geosporum TaxID=1117311 RepID=A0A9W4WW48_9GLOM|nr:8967_t:CDS:2 [Funneliformis geosporum]
MLGRVVISIIGAGFAVYCVVTAFLTYFEKNPATLHLTNFYLVGYAAINAVFTPFGISGVVGGLSRKKSLIKAFTRFQWWLATFILTGLNVFNVILSRNENNKKGFIGRCQSNFAKGQPETDFLARCKIKVEDAEQATFIAACSQGGIMLFLGVILLIVGTREYNSISLEEETRNLLEKANFNENDEIEGGIGGGRSSSNLQRNISDASNGGNVDGRYPSNNVKNIRRQPSNIAQTAAITNNMNAIQQSGLRRHPTEPSSMPSSRVGRNQAESSFMSPSYTSLARNTTNPGSLPSNRYNGITRYPTNPSNGTNISANRVKVTRQPTIGNAYVSMNYAGAPQTTYPIVPQHSLSTKRYVSPPPPYVVHPSQQIIVPITKDYHDDPYSFQTDPRYHI